MKSGTSWKVLSALIIVAAVFVTVVYSIKDKTTDDVVLDYYTNASSTASSTKPLTATTSDGRVLQNLMVACAAPAKNQVLATASSSKRLMWSATPSVEGKIVEGANLEWTLMTPEKKVIQNSSEIGLVYTVERSSFPAGVKKQTYTMQVKVTMPTTGQFLVAACAPVDVTLQ